MLDPQTEEQASLYVLGLLDPAETRDFEIRCHRNPGLREMVRDLKVNLEAMALASPPLQPPPDTYQHAWQVIQNDTVIPIPFRSGLRPWLATAAALAACLAAGLLVWHFLWRQNDPKRYFTFNRSDPGLSSNRSRPARGSASPAPSIQDGATVTPPLTLPVRANPQELKRLNTQLQRERERNRALASRLSELEQNATNLENRLNRYLQGSADSKHLVITSMRHPLSQASGLAFGRSIDELLAKEAWNQLAMAQTKPSTSPATDVTTSREPVYIGSLSAPTSLTPSQSTVPNSMTAATDAFAGNSAEKQTGAAENAGVFPIGVALYDQTEQTGSLIVQNLPLPPANQCYQVWAFDLNSNQPWNVGLLPSLPNGNGQANFSLPVANFFPTKYVVTLEPLGGSPAPTGPVVLTGPGEH